VRWVLVAVTALIGVALPEVSGAGSANNVGVAIAASGTVTVTRIAAGRHPLRPGDTLYWGDVVEARKNGFARLWLGGTTTVTVKELSRLELQKEVRAEGTRYTLELAWGKLRVSVARLLMRQGEYVEVRTRNAVASVRGTDFLVETTEHRSQKGAFGLLGASAVGPGVKVDGPGSMETVLTTLSGVVELSNRPPHIGRVERVRASETSGVRGSHDPVQLHLRVEDLK
jgi:hypothetical protein